MKKNRALWTGVASAAILFTGVTAAKAIPGFAPVTYIPIPASSANREVGGAFISFDISTYDPASGMFYLGDRSNAGIDIFNLNNNTFVGTLAAGQFTGHQSSNAASGADGTAVFNVTAGSATVPVGTKLVLGGDGNSTVKAYVVPQNTPGNLATYNSTPVYTVSTVLPGSTVAASLRADEMTYNPHGNNVLVANNAASPSPFTTLFNATTGAIISQTVYDGTNGTPNAVGQSIEASAYDPVHNVFWLAIPQIGASASDPGGLSEVNGDTGAVIATFAFSSIPGVTACSPTGVGISTGGSVAVGCSAGGSQTILFDTTSHHFSTVAFSGTDAVTFDPQINAFLLSGANNVPKSFGIIDAATGLLNQTPSTSPGNDHSIDGGQLPNSMVNVIGVPEPANANNNAACLKGCLEVFSDALAVPEPGTLPVLATGMVVLAGFAFRRRLN